MKDPLRHRKVEHLEAVLNEDVSARDVTTGFERLRFVHDALPELDLGAVDLSTSFLGRRLKAPLLVSSMTGGPAAAGRINAAIAEAAGRLGIAFGVGSQRVALEAGAIDGFSPELRRRAGPVPILANLGAAQITTGAALDLARRALDMIEADALIIHLNPLQEALQAEGDRDWRGILGAIERLAASGIGPIVVKEVGFGLSAAVARRLWDAGVRILDVAGAGGTSWAAVEAERAPNPRARATAETFRDWGIPTADALVAVRATCPEATVIASGGLRSGLDAAKAIRLGADLAGFAAAVLPAALAGPDALADHFQRLIDELAIACFCTGSANLAALAKAPITGFQPVL
jgi:isopentenyl-diphosphate delta-isomerase